jgi:hypothetical protein
MTKDKGECARTRARLDYHRMKKIRDACDCWPPHASESRFRPIRGK